MNYIQIISHFTHFSNHYNYTNAQESFLKTHHLEKQFQRLIHTLRMFHNMSIVSDHLPVFEHVPRR